jgi:hypothetical protein
MERSFNPRPLHLHGAGHLTFTGGPPPTGGTLTASGTATHLDQWTATDVLTFSGSAANLTLASGRETFTAANGDELNARFTNAELETTTGIAHGIFFFVGGTGRFNDASGSAPFVVLQDPDGSFELTALGRIDF